MPTGACILRKSPPSVSVIPYDFGKFTDVVVQNTKATRETLKSKQHCLYFQEYFNAIKVRTMVVEAPYTDHDFMEDHVRYFSRCFRDIPKVTARVLFFGNDFAESDFVRVLSGQDEALLQQLKESFQGFIVLKPLARTVFGRTCLKTYEGDSGRRYFPSARICEANLCGIRLGVRSLNFQEQDRAVAACASSALWTAFHTTSKLFQHRVPSPAEITQLATDSNHVQARKFPNQGLTGEEMGRAVYSVGLDAEPLNLGPSKPEDRDYISEDRMAKAVAYAYLSAGISPVLVGHVIDTLEGTKILGKHAVAVTGYRLEDAASIQETRLLSDCISKLYVHDDQVGPFARMAFEIKPRASLLGGSPSISTRTTMTTCWRPGGTDETSDAYNPKKFWPKSMLLPLYPKIRIPFLDVLRRVISFDHYIQRLSKLFKTIGRQTQFSSFMDGIEWDIILCESGRLKEDYRGRGYTGVDLVPIMKTPLPRFVWRARAVNKRWKSPSVLFDVLFDATDLEQMGLVCGVVPLIPSIMDIILLSVSVHDSGSHSEFAEIRNNPISEYIKQQRFK